MKQGDASMSDDVLLRQYERELDALPFTFPIVRRDREAALFAVLAAYDSLALTEVIVPPHIRLSPSGVIHAKYLEDGLTYAIRWLYDGREPCDLRPCSSETLANEAGTFLLFAREYAAIADLHQMYGRGQVDVRVDSVARTVSFSYLHEGLSPVSGSDDTGHTARQQLRSWSNPEMISLVQQARSVMEEAVWDRVDGRLVLRDYDLLCDTTVADFCRRITPENNELIGSGTDLCGFSLEQYAAVITILRNWSTCALCRFVAEAQSGVPQVECSATQVVERVCCEEVLGSATGLGLHIIRQIIGRLAYDKRTRRPDVLLQPLVCGHKTVAWSSRVMQSTREVRNLLRLMARTNEHTEATSTIIGKRERPMLVRLGEMFATRGRCQFKVMQKLSLGEDVRELDLLVYNPKEPTQLLLIEGKAVLGADEINEVDTATNEMMRGQEQLRACRHLLCSMTLAERNRLFPFVRWECVSEWYSLVVSFDSDPNEKYDHSEIPGISLATVSSRCRDKHFKSPKAFWLVCKERRWQRWLYNLARDVHPIRMGEITYNVPIVYEPERA
jgi:hypothetical protein